MMKIFWWGLLDPIYPQRTLWYLIDGAPVQSYDNLNDIGRLVDEGYTEVSWQTAHSLGYPV